MRPVPERTCVACRTRRDKAVMVRIVRRHDGSVAIDGSGVAEGRGAYLCADSVCWEVALKRSALQSALRTSLPEGLRAQLEQGDVSAIHIATDHGAPDTFTGGTHGT